MKYTANYNMKKPEATDSYNVDDFNENIEIIDAQMKNHSDRIFGHCNKNLVPNILPLAGDVNAKVSANPTTLASVSMLHFGDVKWQLQQSSTQKDWSVYVGNIDDGTDDANYGGTCKRYIGYTKPAGAGCSCFGLYCQIKAANGTVFKAGKYTLSFWACVEGDSAYLCPHITTQKPTTHLNEEISGVIMNKWKKYTKTVSISSDSESIFAILDSFNPSQNTNRILRCADIKLEYGEVATRFDPDYSKELIMKTLYEMQNGG